MVVNINLVCTYVYVYFDLKVQPNLDFTIAKPVPSLPYALENYSPKVIVS